MAEAQVIDPHETVSTEDTQGRVLTGSGVSEDALQEGLRDADVKPLEGQPENEPKPSKGSYRYTKLTARAESAEAAAAAAQQRSEELANRLALLEANAAKQLVQQEQPVEVVPEGRQKPVAADIGTKYADYESFVEDLADWKTEQREIKLRAEFDARFEQRIEAERASRAQSSQADTVLSRGRAHYSDFDAVVNGCQVQFPEAMLRAIVSLPHAEHVEYALAKDPDLAARIAKIPDGLTLGMELAKLMPPDGRVTPASRPSVVRTSQAPPPIEPVGTGTSTTSPPLADLAASGNYEAYKAQRKAQLAQSGGARR